MITTALTEITQQLLQFLFVQKFLVLILVTQGLKDTDSEKQLYFNKNALVN